MAEESFGQSHTVAELAIPATTAQIMRLHLDRPTDRVFRRDDHYWLDLALTPRPERARGCYHDHWGPHRFERLGDLFLVPPGQSLRVRTEVGLDQSSIVCEIRADAIDRWLDGGVEWTDRRLEACLDIASPHIRAAMSRLAHEVRQPGFASEMLATHLAGQIAIEVARYCQAVADGPVTGGLASWRLRVIDERLQRMGELPSLGELARLCNLSVRQLTRGFRASRGVSIGDHVAQSRIELAKRQLAGPDSIKTIGFALGFGSPSSFAYAFRRATGSTPRQFRQRHLRASE